MKKIHSEIIWNLVLAALLCVFAFPAQAHAGFFSNDREGYTKFHDAAKVGDVEQLQQYLDKSFDINKRSRSAQCTALGIAVRYRKYNAVKFLLEQGADTSISFRLASVRYTPLQMAAKGGDLSLVQLLMQYTESPDEGMRVEHPTCNASAFTWACIGGHLQVAKYLLEKGADINIRNSTHVGYPLVASARKLQIETVRFLLKNGADVNVKDSRGRTAMDYVNLMIENDSNLQMILSRKLQRTPSVKEIQQGVSLCNEIKRLLEIQKKPNQSSDPT